MVWAEVPKLECSLIWISCYEKWTVSFQLPMTSVICGGTGNLRFCVQYNKFEIFEIV
jgi:hypothetical protein